ncbi:MAG: DUF5018 domain-containing protein [Muribaculaceae bacterium]
MKKFYSVLASVMLLSSSAFAEDAVNTGIDVATATPLFDISLETYGVTAGGTIRPSLAMCGEYLVLNLGDGSKPLYLDPVTGEKKGEIIVGIADPKGSVASDVKGNMLIASYCESGTFKIFKTNKVNGVPMEWASVENPFTGLKLGTRLDINGDLDGNAVVAATFDGLYAQHMMQWVVKDGVVGEATMVTIEGVNQWAGGSSNTKVIFRSSNVEDGYFLGHYYWGDDLDKFYFVDGTTNTAKSNVQDKSEYAWAYAPNSGDAIEFNGAKYLVIQDLSYFGYWGLTSYLYLYDVTDISNFSGELGAETTGCIGGIEVNGYHRDADSETGDPGFPCSQTDTDGLTTGDVLIATTADDMVVYSVSNVDLGISAMKFGKSTGVSAVETSDIRAFAANGNIVVNNPNAENVTVYTVAGAEVANTSATDASIAVAPGLYIVKAGNAAQKILVK